MSVTVRSIAERSKVSVATVSRVLSRPGDALVAEPTRLRVLAVAKELGYHPSAVARGLSRKRMDTLGLVLPRGEVSPAATPFFTALFNGVLEAAATHHQNMTVFTGETWRDAHSLPRFRDGRCDGLLLFYQHQDSDIVTALLDANVPTVMVSDVRDDPRLSYVDVDNVDAARRMTEHLLGLGHRRITVVTEEPSLTFALARYQGIRQALTAQGLAAEATGAVATGFSAETIHETISALMERPESERPTALFCLSDSLAAFVMTALGRLNLRVPEDVSVAGFNDDGAADHAYPPLTTMHQPYRDLGEAAVSLLLEQVRDRSLRGHRIILPTELTVRQSTAPPPAI